MGVVLATLSMVLAGVGSICFKECSTRIGAAHTTRLYYLFGLVFSAAVPLVLAEKARVTRGGVAWAVAAALVLSLSVLCFNASLRTLKVSTAATIYSFEFVVTILLAVAFRGEALGVNEWAAAGLALAAIVVYAL